MQWWRGGGAIVVQDTESPDFRSPEVGISASELTWYLYSSIAVLTNQ